MNERDDSTVDTSPTEHEQRVVEERDGRRNDDPTTDPGRRPTAEEDLAADKAPSSTDAETG